MFNCKTCKNEFKNRSHGKPKYCLECLPEAKVMIAKMNGHKNKGKSSWNKGKPNTWTKPGFILSEETKKKVSEAKKGTISPLKGKPRLDLRGENNGMWKGGSGTERHQAMGKIEYKMWRTSVFQIDNYTCQDCGAKGVYLHADHIKSWADYPKLRYELSNGRTLCTKCHYKITFGKEMPKDIKWGEII